MSWLVICFNHWCTGPALRDVTPDATLAITDWEMPGFGEQMRK